MGAKRTKPDVDRGQIRQILDGLTEGVLLVDPDRSIEWANDTALAIHGCVGPGELGTDATEYRKRFPLTYRNHHRLKVGQYPVERILAGEAFRGVVVQVSRREDPDFQRVHEVRGLALTNARGATESLVLMIKDVTTQFEAEERFERVFAANPAPALICRLSDARYVKVSPGFLGMTGYDSDAVVGYLFHELDVLDRAEHRDEALACMREHRTIPQQEAMLRVPGGSKYVMVAGQPIDVAEEPCMLFTFIDLDARKQAEISLKDSEERFSKAFRLAPVPMLVLTVPGLLVLEVNDAFAAIAGNEAADVIGRTIAETGLWKDQKTWHELRGTLESGQGVRDRETGLRTDGGASIDCLLSAEPVTIHDRPCALCVVRDITERKRTETDLVTAIEAVMKDTSWFSHTVMEKLAQFRHPDGRGAPAQLALLTPREREVLELICEGNTDAEIATSLGLSRNTVRNHVASLYEKIGVNRRSAAVVWGRERGVVGY